MSFYTTVKGWFNMLLPNRAKEQFDIEPITSGKMLTAIKEWGDIYEGNPPWLNPDEHIRTINFAKSVCSETARLALLAANIQVDGSARAKWLQGQIDAVYPRLREWIEYGNNFGTVILKPNGEDVDIYMPGDFLITDTKHSDIMGAVFIEKEYSAQNKRWFTRLEYHRFEGEIYAISNRCFIGKTKHDSGKSIAIELTPWAGLAEDVTISGLEKPLFGVYRTPAANNIELDSPLGIAIYADALQELADLDVAYSRNTKEIADSKRTVLLDSDRLFASGTKVKNAAASAKFAGEALGLPDVIKAVNGNGDGDIYHEINPTLNTDARLSGINALLSEIGFKCGYSNGYFVFNEKTGMVTATQVESDDRRTIQLIKDVRDKVQACLDGLVYAIDKFADLYALAPVGTYEIVYDFGDITYNRDEDRARWYSYVTAGRVPFWYYLVKYEGYSEQDAKKLEEAAKTKETLFGDDE